MTRIGLVSDSHGKLKNLKKAVKEMGDVDLIIHMGDYIEDADTIRNWVSIPVMAVKGNMDSYFPDRPDFLKTEVEGLTLYVAHGHHEHVKWGTDDFLQTVKSNEADIGIFGHTHKKKLYQEDGVVLINPGSISLPNDETKSYAILTLDNKDIVDCQFYELN